jgi:hypothetical protein
MSVVATGPSTPEIDALRKQVAAQCGVVAHLAIALAQVHQDYARIFKGGPSPADSLLDMKGRHTASLMERLGDILNGMDAITDEDEWTVPIFKEAQRLWPSRAALTPDRSED